MEIKNSPIDFTSTFMSGLNSAFGGLFGLAGSGLQMRNNKRLQKYAAELQYDTWAKMTENTRNWNEYQEKLSKMAEAGLNPLYSEGNAPQSPIAAAAPSASAGMPLQDVPFNLGDSVVNALKARELTYKEREVAAQEKQAAAYEKKSDAETETILKVMPHTVNEACERAENMKLSNEEKRKLIDNIDAELHIKQQEADAAMTNALAHSLEAAVAQSANEWQEDVARQNANANSMNAQTNYYNFGLAKETLTLEIEKYANTATQQYHEYLSRLKKQTFETINEMRESMSRDMGPFHIRFPLDELVKTAAEAKAINDYIKMDDARDDAKMELRKLLNDIYDMQSRIQSVGFPKDSKKPKFKLERGYNPSWKAPWTPDDGSY